MRRAVLLLALLLAACSKPQPPVGRWEGGYQSNSTLIAARVEVLADGRVRASAPDVTGLELARPERMAELRVRLTSDLSTSWDAVPPRKFDFDGTTFRKPGGIAPQMVWDKKTNQMTIEIFIGANPALPVTLRPVGEFSDNPWPLG